MRRRTGAALRVAEGLAKMSGVFAIRLEQHDIGARTGGGNSVPTFIREWMIARNVWESTSGKPPCELLR
jgi:hypothetical protein